MPDNKPDQGFFSKMYYSFIKNDITTVHNRVWDEVVVPTIENMLIDGVNTALATLFDRKRNVASNRPGSTYGSFYVGPGNKPATVSRDTRLVVADANHFNPSDHILQDREAAEIVLLDLWHEYERYGKAKLADFYNSGPIGITPEPVAYEYGWYDLSEVKPIKLVGGGWILNLPRPVPLNRR